MSVETVTYTPEGVRLLDQRRLPAEETYLVARTPEEVAEAIEAMVVRGAPAIGITAAFGIALAARLASGETAEAMDEAVEKAAKRLAATRPTAVNLFWAVERMKAAARRGRREGLDNEALARALEDEARRIHDEDLEACRRMGRMGAELVPDEATILTHCNAGGLATAGYGTALGVVRGAVEAGKRVRVLADETRPFLQGARLTAWELMRDGIETVLVTDNAAASLMQRGLVDMVVVGADRIAANGDVANKIGTYGLAVLAHEHDVPFYVAAPLSTVDLACPSGEAIPIEHRDPAEVSELFGVRVAPEGVQALNPAFDITPARYIDAIITERGVARPPYEKSLRALVENPVESAGR